jgi:hypothetical protein
MHPSDITLDIELPDRCNTNAPVDIDATAITVNGEEYYYVKNDNYVLGYSIYKFNARANGYEELSQSSKEYLMVIRAIKSKGK